MAGCFWFKTRFWLPSALYCKNWVIYFCSCMYLFWPKIDLHTFVFKAHQGPNFIISVLKIIFSCIFYSYFLFFFIPSYRWRIFPTAPIANFRFNFCFHLFKISYVLCLWWELRLFSFKMAKRLHVDKNLGEILHI